ncbi:MAG: hypothetical protein ACTSRC_16005 [Candidatus Helarchaeota archaeon]
MSQSELSSDEQEEYTAVKNLRPSLRSINLKVKCASIDETREGYSKKTGESYKVTEALVGDETGCVLVTLWNEIIQQIEVDKVYSFTNVYTSIFKNSLRLNIGKYGKVEEIDEESPIELNEENNLSNEFYEQPRRRHQYRDFQSSNNSGRTSWRQSWSNRKRQRRY